MSNLIRLSTVFNHELRFDEEAQKLGFSDSAVIRDFLFVEYADVVRKWKFADRLRGCVFILKPAIASSSNSSLDSLLQTQVKASHGKQIIAIPLATPGGSEVIAKLTPAQSSMMSNGQWPPMFAQSVSREAQACVIWVAGVSANIYINGEQFLETPDVIEKLPTAHTCGFQALSWNDGEIIFDFCASDLNDSSRLGIWNLPAQGILEPKPEELIRMRLGNFLKNRLAGYKNHQEEAHVEHEGRADVTLHLIDDRVLILEIKWVGCSLKSTHSGKDAKEVKAAFDKGDDWFTRFDVATINSGVRQLANYFATGTYQKAYLAVIDCTVPTSKPQVVVPDVADLCGHSAASFKVIRGSVDPRSSSVKAKKRAIS